MASSSLESMFSTLLRGAILGEAQAADLVERMLSEDTQQRLSEPVAAAVLALLATREPSVDELVGGAMVMRRHAAPVQPPQGAKVLDTCSTGGAPKTFNVSTLSAIVTAAAVPVGPRGERPVVVAKHGNRSRTGRGSTELLMALGVHVEASPVVQERCLRDVGVCFCWAVRHHPAARHAAAVRQALPFATLFNLLGPLSNPAGATHQVMGVPRLALVRPMAEALARLGVHGAMVLHSRDGLDELSVGATTDIAMLDSGSVRLGAVDPRTLGLASADIEAVRVGTLDEAVAAARSVLAGEPGPRRSMVALASAAALWVTGQAPDLAQGLEMAQAAIADGRAGRTLEALADVSRSRE